MGKMTGLKLKLVLGGIRLPTETLAKALLVGASLNTNAALATTQVLFDLEIDEAHKLLVWLGKQLEKQERKRQAQEAAPGDEEQPPARGLAL